MSLSAVGGSFALAGRFTNINGNVSDNPPSWRYGERHRFTLNLGRARTHHQKVIGQLPEVRGEMHEPPYIVGCDHQGGETGAGAQQGEQFRLPGEYAERQIIDRIPCTS